MGSNATQMHHREKHVSESVTQMQRGEMRAIESRLVFYLGETSYCACVCMLICEHCSLMHLHLYDRTSPNLSTINDVTRWSFENYTVP